MRRAVEIKNVGLSFITGLTLILFAFFQIMKVYDTFNDPTVYTVYIEAIVLPFIPAFVGLYLLYKCVKKELVLEILYGKEKYTLRIKDLVKNNQVSVLNAYLNKKT